MRRSTSQKKPLTKRWPCWHSAEQEKQNPPSLERPRIISRPFSHLMRVWVRPLYKNARRTSALAAVGVGSVIFQGTTPSATTHAFRNQFGFDARKAHKHASSAGVGLVTRHPIAAGGVYAHACRFGGGEQLALAAAIAGRHEQMQACRAAENFNFATHFMLQAFHKQVAAFVVCRHGRAGVPIPISFAHE